MHRQALVPLVVALVLAGCMSPMVGCTKDEPVDTQLPADPGTCFDAIRNDTETDVDCGGRCGLDCGIGQTCQVGDDCMFATCGGGVCTAPPDAPAGTGPVTATLTPAGGTLDFVSDEGVSMSLVLPAGALSEPFELTVTPRAPGAGQWFNADVAWGGRLLAETATLTLTLPSGLQTTNATTFKAPTAFGTTHTGSTATVGLRWLGPQVPAYRDGETPATLEEVDDAVLMQQLVDQAQAAIDADAFDPQVAFLATLAAGLQRAALPDHEADIDTLLGRINDDVCGQIARKTALLGNSDRAKCPWEVRQRTETLGGWVSAAQQFGTSCAALDSNEWQTEIQAELASATATFEDDPAAYRACECENPDSGLQGCLRDAAEDALWERKIEGVGYNEQSKVRLGVLGQDALGDTLDSGYAEPFREELHEQAWDLCHDDGEQWVLAGLSQVVADPAPVQKDVQYCGSQLGLDVQDDQGAVLRSAVAGGEGPLLFTEAASTSAPAGGKLVLKGPLRALRCHDDPPRYEDDELVVKLVASTGTSEVARREANANGYLTEDGDPLELDVDTLVDELDGDSNEPIVLEVWRESPSCGGAFGPTEVQLFTVTAEAVPSNVDITGTYSLPVGIGCPVRLEISINPIPGILEFCRDSEGNEGVLHALIATAEWEWAPPEFNLHSTGGPGRGVGEVVINHNGSAVLTYEYHDPDLPSADHTFIGVRAGSP